ncbi:MAG TPA: MarR family transcriptional regulator [Mycobacteriales bacterium]|nr:MarR family transcriptional regulator [Mycobacteriales bacterium]
MSTTTLAHADAASRLRLAIARLARQLRQQTLGSLTLTQWSALATVETHEPVRIGDLAEREGVSAATATRVVAALEERGLVARSADVADRRSWRVSLTVDGRRELIAMRKVRTARLAQRIADLDPADARRLSELLPVLETLAGDD